MYLLITIIKMTFTIERNATLQKHAVNAAIHLKDKYPDKDLEDYLQSLNLYSQKMNMENETFIIFKIHFEYKLRELFQNN